MAEALAVVKQELGRDAVVLHTRSIKRGGLMGFGARTLIEVTAADGREVARERRRVADQSPRAKALRQAAESRSSVAVPSPAEQQTAGDLIRRTYQAARSQFDAAPAFSATEAQTSSVATVEPGCTAAAADAYSPTVRTTAPAAGFPSTQMVADQLRAVRDLVEQVVQNQQITQTLVAAPPPAALPDPLVEYYGALIEQEVAAQLADELVRTVHPEEVDDVAAALRQQIAQRLIIDDQTRQFVAPPGGGPRVIALVGPTGVGKTTTVAKLAATFKLKQNLKVGLITADTYRIAAVEQLRTYAQIIGLPLQIVTGPQELSAAMDQMQQFDVVLIDTAGRSQKNTDRLDELSTLLQIVKPHETHLVLSATASQRVLMQTIDKFEAVRPDRLIFTKLDEAVTLGAMLNVAERVKKPLSYITTGQEVPHQIEACDADRLAQRLLGKEAVSV